MKPVRNIERAMRVHASGIQSRRFVMGRFAEQLMKADPAIAQEFEQWLAGEYPNKNLHFTEADDKRWTYPTKRTRINVR